VHAPLTLCRDPSFLSASVRFNPSARLDPATVLATLGRYAGVLWRAKGYIPTAHGLAEVQWTMDTPCSISTTAAPRGAQPALVLIARGDAGDALDRLAAELT
jgi:hypothetical protein